MEDFYGTISLDLLLRLLDKYPLKIDRKGGFIDWNPRRIYITSEVHPQFWYAPDHMWHGGSLARRLSKRGSRVIKCELVDYCDRPYQCLADYGDEYIEPVP